MNTRIFGMGIIVAVLATSIVFSANDSTVVNAAQVTVVPTTAATMSADQITQTTLLRVVHASPDASNVDVYLDKSATPVITNLAFDNATDGYLPVPAGDHQITITAAGDTKTVLYDEKLTLPGSTALTLIAEGLLSNKSFGIRITLDDVSSTNGKARIKITHAVADAPAVDLVTADFKTTLIANLPYGYSQTILVDPGSYNLVVVPTGRQTPVVIDLTGAKFDSDQIYTVFATGKLSETIKPLLFITSPIPGFQLPISATPEATMVATKAATKTK